MKIPWAYDSWFPLDDKLAHFAIAAWVAHLVGWPVALVMSVAIEALEWWRWRRWVTTLRGAGAWPFLADRPSYRDLAYDAAGIIFGLVVP
jgi:hypothetical protein